MLRNLSMKLLHLVAQLPSARECLAQAASELKAEGNACFVAGNQPCALACYRDAVTRLTRWH